jgi:hypothetical protein
MMLGKEAENWSTPGASDGGANSKRMERGKVGANLKEHAENWQSPQAKDWRSGEIDPETAAKHLGSRPLNEEVLNWGTPESGTNNGLGQDNPTRASRLEDQVQNWLTPGGGSATDRTGKKGAGGEHAEQATNWQTSGIDSFRSRGGDRVTEEGLDQQARNWSTPSGHDPRLGYQSRPAGKKSRQNQQKLSTEATLFISHPTEPATGTDGKTCWCLTPGCDLPSHRRRLNIYFDEWLMGWPVNWSSATDERIGFEAWETASCRLMLRWLSLYSGGSMDSTSEGATQR